MRKILGAVALVGALGLSACGGSSNSSGSGGGGGSSNQTCMQQYDCVNGSCTCSSGPNKNNSCCDPNDSNCTNNKCDTYCRYCQ